MEIVIAAVVLAAGLVAGASLLSRRAPALAGSRTGGKAAPAAAPASVAAPRFARAAPRYYDPVEQQTRPVGLKTPAKTRF